MPGSEPPALRSRSRSPAAVTARAGARSSRRPPAAPRARTRPPCAGSLGGRSRAPSQVDSSGRVCSPKRRQMQRRRPAPPDLEPGAVAARAPAVAGVEREQPRVELLEAPRAGRAGPRALSSRGASRRSRPASLPAAGGHPMTADPCRAPARCPRSGRAGLVSAPAGSTVSVPRRGGRCRARLNRSRRGQSARWGATRRPPAGSRIALARRPAGEVGVVALARHHQGREQARPERPRWNSRIDAGRAPPRGTADSMGTSALGAVLHPEASRRAGAGSGGSRWPSPRCSWPPRGSSAARWRPSAGSRGLRPRRAGRPAARTAGRRR